MISVSDVKELRDITGAGMMDCKKALEECNGNIKQAVDWLREKGFAQATKKSLRIAAEGLANIYIDNNKAVIVELNSETDFVSKNDEFKDLIDTIGNTILKNNAVNIEEALNLKVDEDTINDLIVSKTAKIGEKLSLRRFEVLNKNDDEIFGTYLHMGGKIAAITVIKGSNEEVAKDVAMQAAAMKPLYVFETDVPEEVLDREKEVLKNQTIEEGKSEDIAEKMVVGRIKKFYSEICLANQPFIKDGDIDVKTYVTNSGGEIKSMIRYEVGEGIEKRNDDFASEVMNQAKGN